MCTPIKVFLLAGNRLLRETLMRILRKPSDMVLAGEAFDYGSALSVIGGTAADVLLMDSASMPPLTLALLGQVRRLCPAVQALVIGRDESEAAFLQAVRAGASGYLLRNASAREVLTAIRAFSQGQSVCPPTLCAALFKIAARPQSPGPTMHASPISVPATSVPAFRLPVTGVAMTGVPMNLHSTPRQPELVSLIAQGLTNHEIAARLNLAAQTIENHIHRMSGKVGTEERAKVVEITRVRNAVR